MLFDEVFNYFKSKNCMLLTDENEYKILKSLKKIPKLKYIASCGHEHEIHYNVFKSRNSGIICPSCKLKSNSQKKLGISSKINDGQSLNQFNEEKSINYFIDFIKNKFISKKTFEGCLSDLVIKPINNKNNLWLQIQVKSILKRFGTYSFNNNSKYDNCIILCICWEDKRMWLFDGNVMKLSKISIGYKKSKYEINEINDNNIFTILDNFYNNIKLFSFDECNLPLSDVGKKEIEYKKLRIDNIITNFIEVSNYLHYDFLINDKKIQEKIGFKFINKNAIYFTLKKSNGKINDVRKFIPYDKGDNDFYWLHFPNKQNFYLIPENNLINKNNILIKSLYIKISIGGIPKNNIYDEFLFDYKNIDYEKFNKLIST